MFPQDCSEKGSLDSSDCSALSRYKIKYRGGCPGDEWDDETEVMAENIACAGRQAEQLEVKGKSLNDADYDLRVTAIIEQNSQLRYCQWCGIAQKRRVETETIK